MDFGARIYDSRLGRWLSVDPYLKSYLSPYSFGRNSPPNIMDPDGNDEIHFHYLTLYTPFAQRNANGSFTMGRKKVKVTWVNVIKDNYDLSFYVHKDAINSSNKTTPSTPTQFFPDPAAFAAPKTGITNSTFFGFIDIVDDDYTALLKILDDFPDLQGKVFPYAFEQAGTYDKDRAFWGKVYSDKRLKATVEREKEIETNLMIGVITSIASEFVLGGKLISALVKAPEAYKIGAVRLALNVGEGKNIAYVEGVVGAESLSSISVSGQTLRDFTVGNPTKRFFETKVVGFNRAFDSEVKLLEDFAQQYYKTPNISATLKLVSERPFCTSCSGVIEQFQKMFPNVKLELVSGIK